MRNQSEPQQLDLFAFQQLQQENERLRLQIAQMADVRCMMDDEPFARPEGTLANARTVNPEPLTVNQPRPRRQRKQSSERPCSVRSGSVAASQAACPAIPLQENNSDLKDLFKAIGMVAVATVALFVIYETGLLIPLGLIGLVTGGLLK